MEEPQVEIKPCVHMKFLITDWKEGRLRGLLRWYVGSHIARCKQCQAALQALAALRDRLQNLGRSPVEKSEPSLTPPRRAALEKAMTEIERRSG